MKNNSARLARNTFAFIATILGITISYGWALPAQALGPRPTGEAQTVPITRHNVVQFANADRAVLGTAALTEDAMLNTAAQMKANDMAAKGYFAHVDPQGNTPWYWFKKVGYYYWAAGENLAVNFDDAQTLNTAWMNSPLHRANILQQNYSRIGIGIAHGTYQGKPATYIVQFFAKPYIAKASSYKVSVR